MNRKLTVIAATIIIISIIGSVIAYNYYNTANEPTGTITVSGAFALYPMMVKWAEEYQKIHPNVSIQVSAGGAGKGMTDALNGLVDIGMVSRAVTQQETDQGAFYVAVVKDAVLATINKNNPVLQDILTKGIKRSTFQGIFIYGNITTWGQVVGRPEVTDKIDVYTRSDSCGAAETWAKYLGGSSQADLNQTFAVGVSGDPGLAEAVRSDSLGIGYNNVNYAYDATTEKPVDGLEIVPIDINENGQIDPSESFYANRTQIIDAIATGAYPSPPSRELNLVTKDGFGGITLEFVGWILSDAGGQQYALETGYVPLSDLRRIEMLDKLG